MNLKTLLILLFGIVISSLPLLWPLTAENYDPDYGKLPLWLLANCGVISIASIFCVIILLICHRRGLLWIPILGFLLIPLALAGGFTFFALGFLLLPIAPILLLISGLEISKYYKKGEASTK
jgi:hypothetical protein